VACDGYFVAECKTLDDVRQHLDLAGFLEEALACRQPWLIRQRGD